MSWAVVARKDYRDAVQSRALWGLVVVFVVLSVISTYAYVSVPELFGEPTGATFDGLVFFTVGLAGLFVPLAAIVVCYRSLAGERELGSIKLLMALPATRSSAFAGKVVGRAAVLVTGLLVAVAIGIGFGAVLLRTFEPVTLAVVLLVTLVFVAIYAGIMVSISATTGSTSRATTLAIGFFVVFELVWDVIPLAVVYVAGGFSLPSELPDWVVGMAQVSPSMAYFSSLTAIRPGLGEGLDDTAGQAGVVVENGSAGGDSLLTSPELGILFLAFWLVVPLAVGYYRFSRADL